MAAPKIEGRSDALVQIWHQMFSPDGSRLAAIVAPKYGRWTVAVDGEPWPATFTRTGHRRNLQR